MSRDGPASPVPRPASAVEAAARMPGSQPVPGNSSSTEATAIAIAIVCSSRSTRATRNPPITIPIAPHSM
jgi:hypothetical protein